VPKRDDPYLGFNFVVELGGEAAAGFSEVDLGAAHVELIQYREGADRVNSVRKLPGLARYDNVVLKRGIAGDTTLWDWFDGVRDGSRDARDVRIVLLDEQRQPVARWLLREAIPVKYEGPALRAAGNEVAVETLELAHERLEFESD
jgi:phage tail-like protein